MPRENKLLEKEITLKTRGQCMQPLIKDKEIVRIRPAQKVRSGDVIAYFNEHHELIIHRYGKLFSFEKTKADNNLCVDPWNITKVLGKVQIEESKRQKIKKTLEIKLAIFRESLRKTREQFRR